MLNTLHSRLWLSHSLLILLVLLLMSAGLLVYLVRNPLADRQAVVRLEVAAGILERQLERRGLEILREEPVPARLDSSGNFRVIIRSRSDGVLFDSAPLAPDPDWSTQAAPLSARGRLTDPGGQIWLYAFRPLPDNRQLFVLAPRAGGLKMLLSPQFREVFRDEIVTPFLRIGLAAGLLAFVTAFAISRSITRPLQEMARAAEELADGEHQRISPSGPEEIRSLARSFNHMSERIQASRESQQDFTANVSHELKTPLTSIRGFARAIQDGTAGPGEGQRRAAEIIEKEANRMHRLVQQLLVLAQLDSGTAGLHRMPIQLEDVLQGVVDQLSPLAKEAGLSLTLEMETLPTCWGDPDRLAQVFLNLVDNAIRHGPAGSVVVINAGHQAGELRVSVSDNGAGIPLEEQKRIFERFYQVDKSRDRSRSGGTGLGLTIAQELVAAHRGSIDLTSAPGEGTTFMVKIPAVDPGDDTVVSRQEGKNDS